MKGKATLILLDPETGEEVKRIEEENMVTNVIEKLLDITRCGMFLVMNIPNILNNLLPLWKNVLGGVMLLGSNIDEDRDIITPPDGFIPVGTAGTVYSGTDTRRGTLNENESGPIDGGYRLVWDFGTDRANGVIRCIALTSKIFGNNGFDADGDRSANLFCQTDAFSTGSSSAMSILNAEGSFVGSFEHCKYLTLKINGLKLVFTQHTLPDPEAISLTDTARVVDPSPVVMAEMELPFYAEISKLFVDPEEMLIYLFGRSTAPDGSYDMVLYVGIDPKTFEIKASGSYKSDIYTDLGMAVYKGEIYRHRGSYIEVRSLSGELLRTIPVTTGGNAYFYVFDGHLCYGYSAGNYTYHARVGCGEKNGSYGFDSLPVYSCDVKPPYTLISSRGSTMSSLLLMVHSGYTATINNLADPLEKTDMHALKIIYDITN